jgi:iduronate 2-sulfatase
MAKIKNTIMKNLIFTLLLAISTSLFAQPKGFVNPIIPGGHPDPSICQPNENGNSQSLQGDYNENPAKNVLLIIVDDMRPEINAWGVDYIKTPNIDKLVNNGVSFTSAYCQYANCAPSRKSFLTGLSPETTDHKDAFNVYDKVMHHTTMPGFFRENDYYTGSIGKVYHSADDDRDSWNFYYDVGDPQKPEEVPWESYGLKANQNISNNEIRPAVECEDLPLENYNDYNLCQVALKQLQENKDKKFFLAVGFRKPHLPFAAPKKYWDLYKRDNIKLSQYRNAPANGDTIVYQWSELASYNYFATNYKTRNYRNKYVSEEKSKELQHGYYACVSYIDDLVGMLLNKLKELKIDDNTIVVLLADHGYHLGDQQIWGKHTGYDLATRVPLIVYDPSENHDKKICTKFVELLDIYPTLVELCGLPQPKRYDGKSFASLLENTNAEGFDAAFNQYQSFQIDPSIKDLMAYAIHTKDYNYIEWQDLKNNRKVVERELYQVTKGRVEQENIASHPDQRNIIKELSQRIEEKFIPYRKAYDTYKSYQLKN